MKKIFGKTHTMAECRDCNWKTENYIKYKVLAAEHAKKYKHKVNVEMGNKTSFILVFLGLLITIIGLLLFFFLYILKFIGFL